MNTPTSPIKRKILALVILVFIASTGISMLPAATASAQAANDSSTNPDNWLATTRAKRWAHLTGLYNCLDDTNSFSHERENSQAKVEPGDWWIDPTGPRDRFNEPAGYVGITTKDNGTGKADCNDIVKAVMKDYSLSGVELICALGGKRTDNSPCLDSATGANFNGPDDNARLDVSKWWGTKTLPSSAGGAAYYELNLAALTNAKGCNLQPKDNASGDFAYTLNVVDATGKIVPTKYTGVAKDHTINVYTSYPGINNQERSCKDIADDLNKWAPDNANWQQAHLESAQDNTGGGTGGKTTDTACAIEGIGWIVCPVMTFLGTITDLAFNFLSTTFLETKASYFDVSGSNNSAYQAWSYMRNLANVAFAIAFMFIIYSQITGAGASNYGIKKLLPKIIIAAILVNVSFFICQIAIDISNILGYSLKSLFDSIGTSFKSPDAVTQDASGNGFGIAAITIGLLGTGIGLAFALSIPVILAALLALIIIVFILLARTALIILLVVVAPLAFVAYLLPNTEDWYKKWQKMFAGLLLVFPIIAVVFGAAGLAAKIVNATAGDDKMLQVAAIGIATIPLFAVPALLKGAMSAAGAIGTKLSAASGKANSRATGAAKGGLQKSRPAQYMKYRGKEAEIRRAHMQAGTYQGKGGKINPRNWVSRANNAINKSGLSGEFGDRSAAQGLDLAKQQNEEAMKTAASAFDGLDSAQMQQLALGNDVVHPKGHTVSGKSAITQQAAIREKLKTAVATEVDELVSASGGMESQQVRQELSQGVHSNGHVGKMEHLGGDMSDRILRGEINGSDDLDDAMARRVESGKLSAEKLASQDATALERLEKVSKQAASGGRSDISTERLVQLSEQATAVKNNRELAGKILGAQAESIENIHNL